MKNLKIAMILVAAVAFFCSCDGDPVPPTVTISDANELAEVNFDLTNATLDIAFKANIDAEKGISKIEMTKTLFDAKGEVIKSEPLTIEGEYDGLAAYEVEHKETLKKADVETAAKVVYECVVTDKKESVSNTATYTVNVLAVTTFTWVRQGNERSGLDEFGLQWTSNAKAIKAVIKPVEGAKLYILTPADYAANSVSDLNLTTEATQYYSVSCDASANYDDVIATVYNGKTYLMHVTRGEVATGVKAVRVTITGTYKTFEAPAPAAK